MSSKTLPVIQLDDVWRVYAMGESEVQALRGISLSIYQGELVSIMGPSGSGKSTCMNMIGCLDRPSRGSVIIDGEQTAKMSENELANLRSRSIGFVFQQYHLLPTMTVLENVMLPLRYQGLPMHERRERACQMLERVGLADRLSHRPSELSGGQKQRAAIARAAAGRPRIILADEPTGALDSSSGKAVLDLFREINERDSTTVVIVTHDHQIGSSMPRCIQFFDGVIEHDSADTTEAASYV